MRYWRAWSLGLLLLLSWTGCMPPGGTTGILMGEEAPADQDTTTTVKDKAGKESISLKSEPAPQAEKAGTEEDSVAALSQTLLFMPFKDRTKYKGPWDIYTQLPRGLSDTLRSNDFFRIIPMDSVVVRLKGRELKGRISPEKALKIGREFKADFAILGEIEELSMKRFRATMPIGGYRSYQGIASIILKPFKVIDGRLTEEIRGDGETDEKKYGVTNPAAYVKFEKEYFLLGETEWGSEDFHQTLLGQATGSCLQKLAEGLTNSISPPPEFKISEPKIIAIDGAEAYINVGLVEEVENGDKFGVWDEGRELTDTDTGVILGRALPRRIGVVQVEQVLNEHLSLVRILDGQEQIQKGFRIRAE